MKKRMTQIASLLLALVAMQAYAQEPGYSQQVAKCPKGLFVGAIMEAQSLDTETYKMVEADINPVTVTYSFGVPSETYKPSAEEMTAAVRRHLEADGNLLQNVKMKAALGELEDYGRLFFDWGQKVDLAAWSGLPEESKPAGNLVRLVLSRTAFTIGMDIPEALTDDPAVKERADELIYINELSFGRSVTVLLESRQEAADVKAAVQEVLAGGTVSEKAQAILANTTLRIMPLADGQCLENLNPDGLLEGIAAYINRPFTAEDFGQPIAFRAAWVKDNAAFVHE
ncbi:thiol-activated cytolysin family protein [uncultured Bacteroides sp.]|uniref:thiol-activated cytolysin family protein n=1 Tax=uncultured Bacteroides sp. TaxID=162156 RepID=UPI002617BC91|nr:thiol-activated cytolysin family protein [uncultured Bacteroides sp.]